VLHVASAATLERALDRLVDQEQRDRESLPPDVTPIYADDEELIRIRESVEPVRAGLRADAETRPFLERLEMLAGRA
jgi:hypothetical protein